MVEEQPLRRGVGRPRNDQRALTRSPEAEILHQAARLFATRRFEGTSTREIAEAAGLRQSSLFHYFRTKEDILVSLSEELNVRPLANLELVQAMEVSAAAKLYLVLDQHVREALANRWAWRAVLENAQTISRSRFRRYLTSEAMYCDGIAAIVAQGTLDGSFVDEAPGLATARLLGMCNWALRWYKRSGPLSEVQMASYLAEAGLRSIAVDPSVLVAARSEAADGGRAGAAVPSS